MNCVFGEVKSLIRNGEALFEEEMKDYIYEYSAEYVEQQHQQFDLECEVKEINKLTGDGEVFNNCFGEVFEESKQHTKPDYYKLLKDMIKQDKEHKLFQYEYAQKLISRDKLLSHQKRYIRYFVKAHQNKHYEARDQYYEDLINMDTFI